LVLGSRAGSLAGRSNSGAAQQRRQYAARLVAITSEGPGLLRIPGAGGDRLLQLGQPGQMTLHRVAAFRGEPEPRARPPADRALADFHVPGVFEHAGLFRQHRVADPGRITQRGELDPVRAGREQPADRQPGDRVNERIRPGYGSAVPWPASPGYGQSACARSLRWHFPGSPGSSPIRPLLRSLQVRRRIGHDLLRLCR
jgi:hypothetical protein